MKYGISWAVGTVGLAIYSSADARYPIPLFVCLVSSGVIMGLAILCWALVRWGWVRG